MNSNYVNEPQTLVFLFVLWSTILHETQGPNYREGGLSRLVLKKRKTGGIKQERREGEKGLGVIKTTFSSGGSKKGGE